MGNWIDKYRKLIYSSYKQNVIVTDNDNLFAYQELTASLEEEGYTVLKAGSHLIVRTLYELQVRRANGKFIIVAPSGYKPIPDMAGDVLFHEPGLKELFPNLDGKVLRGLGFNALCTLSNIKPNEELGQLSTIIFLLENLYNIDFSSLRTGRSKEKILNSLIMVFSEHEGINKPVTDFLAEQAKPYFPDLVAEGLSKGSLCKFLQSCWKDYAENIDVTFDFHDPILTKSIGFLFIGGELQPVLVSRERFEKESGALRIGLRYDSAEADRMTIQSYIAYLMQQANNIQDNHDEWFSLIQVLAKAMNIAISLGQCDESIELESITARLNERFQRYIDNAYWSVFSLSGIRKPVVVARILDHIKSQPEKKKALIVLDGMNFWQWELMADLLRSNGIECKTRGTMAYVPTITAWSRQAIFKGNKPDLNEDNSREEKLFIDYWRAAAYQDYQVAYKRFDVHHPLDIEEINGHVDILGIVCNDLDDIMHGSILGNKELSADTIQWFERSNLVYILTVLKQRGFRCFLTTDHGSVESKGIKSLTISEKVGSLSRGQRHIRFSNEIMLGNFKEQNPNLKYGLRDTSVFLRDQSAFTKEEKIIVTHGGSHLWEVLIPYVEI